jgi:hypothetical protein
MAFAGSKHHAMFTQTNRLGVMVNGGVANGKKRHCETDLLPYKPRLLLPPGPAAINQQTHPVGISTLKLIR